MTANRADLSHLPPSSEDEIRARLRDTGIELPEELFRQFAAVWPSFEAMVRRVPRDRSYAEEPAHVYRPGRIVRS
jgi:hypothetical protein